MAAAAVGMPWVTHGWGSPLRSEAELRTLEEDAAALWAGAGVEMPPRAGLYEYGLIDPCPAMLDPAPASAATRWPVRPSTLDDEAGGGNEHCGDRSTCYVGFGTVRDLANATREITAAVHGALSVGLRVVVTTSDTSLGQALRAGAEGRVEVREFVSLPGLLSRCRLVVSHGGAGTTLAALAHGVPLVVVPRGLPSQERMAAAVTHANVGRVARADGTDPTAIVDAVRAAADDNAMLQRAEAAQRVISEMPAPEAVIPQLEALV